MTAATTAATAAMIAKMTAVTGAMTAKTADRAPACCGDSSEDALSHEHDTSR